MDFKSRREVRKNGTVISGKVSSTSYEAGIGKSRLQLYSLPPTENISIQEFEDCAVERLKVLKVVENVGLRNKGTQDYGDTMKKELTNLDLWQSLFGVLKENLESDMRHDHISHHILRLAYCKTEDHRRWFLQQEVDFFKFRFSLMDTVLKQQFCSSNNLDFALVDEGEKFELREELAACTPKVGKDSVLSLEFYKVPWHEVLDLVRSRRCLVNGGYAYVVQDDVSSLVVGTFRTRLSEALVRTARALPRLNEDTRLLPLLSSLHTRYLGQDYTNTNKKAGAITAGMIDQLAGESFPLCMQNCHQGLRRTHHMRHWGRMQYGLFLKAIGMSLEEALRFWRAEFMKAMDADKFDKGYAYNIRHNYGKEGKRADYTPHSCIKIIMSNPPGPGDCHGCPFKHSDEESLKLKLQALKLSQDKVDEAVGWVKKGHYQLACGEVFRAQHPGASDGYAPNHPNEYFEHSRSILKGDVSTGSTGGSTPASTPVIKRPYKGKATKGEDGFGDGADDDLMSQSMMDQGY